MSRQGGYNDGVWEMERGQGNANGSIFHLDFLPLKATKRRISNIKQLVRSEYDRMQAKS